MCSARLSFGSASASSGPERRVHRLLSFQRYLHSSRLLRGVPQQIPLHILDEDYTGQARVWHTKVFKIVTSLFFFCLHTSNCTSVFFLLQCMLEKVGTWNFDIFLFDRLTNGMYNMITLRSCFKCMASQHHLCLRFIVLPLVPSIGWSMKINCVT